jgi:hypothetical protein
MSTEPSGSSRLRGSRAKRRGVWGRAARPHGTTFAGEITNRINLYTKQCQMDPEGTNILAVLYTIPQRFHQSEEYMSRLYL